VKKKFFFYKQTKVCIR